MTALAACPGVTPKGANCGSFARCATGSGFCPAHCQCAACVARRAAQGLQGARRRPSAKVIPLAAQPFDGRPANLEQCAEYGAWLVGAIGSGELDPRVGRETAAALNVLKGVLAAKDLTAHKVHLLKEKLMKEMNAQNRDR